MDYFHGRRFLDSLPDWETGRPLLGPLEEYLPRMRALLKRLQDPQRSYVSIIVGGTNGKTTVSRLLASLLLAAGRRVGLYTSPHLHTLRERIQVQGHILGKDAWAEGVTHLHEKSRNFKSEGHGEFSMFEAVTALAAYMFAREDVEYGIFEVGMGGRYDAANAWDSDVAILTSVDLDHVEVLGDDLLGIASEKLCISRPRHPLFTTAGQHPEVLDHIRRKCREHKIQLYVSTPENIEVPVGASILAYPWIPTKRSDLPRTFLDNLRLSLAAATCLLGPGLSESLTRKTVKAQIQPGRFERARDCPLVLLDGAHNPAAAAALAQDLRAIRPSWTFIVGVNSGHDATGILNALGPLATKVILTSSDHPKALGVETLVQSVPAKLRTETISPCFTAFGQTVASLQRGDSLCITGSLHLVARAREFFNLPHEQDGPGEDVALESLECVEEACRKRGIECRRASENENILRLSFNGRAMYFLRNKHPFNDYVGARIAEDKGYQHELFAQAGLPVPYTLQVFNPLADERFNRYKTHRSIEDMISHVEESFVYPLLVKRSRSSVSQGVYLECNSTALHRRLKLLFENSGFSDNSVLIQSYLPGREYRIVASENEMLLAYEKQSGEIDPQVDLNPLHHSSGRAIKVCDPEVLQPMQALVDQVAGVIDLGFYAIDAILGEDGPFILEINPNPFCFFYNRDNGREDFLRIYEHLIGKYIEAGRNRTIS